VELEALQAIHYSILDRDATLLAISPSRPEFARQLAKKLNLSIPILTDQDNALADQYGLVFTVPGELREIYLSFGIDLGRHNGNSSWTLPMPACYIIGQNGLIHDAAVSVDYTTRPEPDETLKKLDALINLSPG
jgi:peroxiredoxin